LLEMKKHLDWFYGRLAKASVPKPNRLEWSEFLPKIVLPRFQALPSSVEGCDYQRRPALTRSDGGQPVCTKASWTTGSSYQGASLRKYLVGSLRAVDFKPITSTPEYITGYGLQSLKSRFSPDEIVIFPRAVSELPANGPGPRKGPVRVTGEKPIYDFQRT
jgi:hypothetical protein